ncbi:MAG: hypothetical protein ABI782_11995 [Anaerolineaceae bacterium]
MGTRGVFLLPLFALAIVGALGGAALLFRSSTSERASIALVTTEPDSPAPDPAYKPGASVCQGVLHRPSVKAERTFPAVYTKRVQTNGLTIVGNAKVDDAAMEAARKTVERLFLNNNLEDRLAEEGAYIIVADSKQGVLDLPEFACLSGQTSIDFNHVCGVADRADYPVATVNELDLLGDRSGPCGGLNILFHEIGHLIQGWTLGPADYFDVKQFYQESINNGTYKRGVDYATTNPNEYFAESTQAYFLSMDLRGRRDRAWLKAHDPDMFALLVTVYGD